VSQSGFLRSHLQDLYQFFAQWISLQREKHPALKMQKVFDTNKLSLVVKQKTLLSVMKDLQRESLLHSQRKLEKVWRIIEVGAGEGDRTLVLSLENSCSTIELHPQLYSKHTDIRSVPPPKKRWWER
jgi:hypothetical protein